MSIRKRYLSKIISIMISIIFSLWAGISLAQLADTPWPMIGHDLKHTGRSPYLGAQTSKLKWVIATGQESVISSPAIGSDGTIYVGVGLSMASYEVRYLYAINPDGTMKWRFAMGDIDSSPAIGSDGTIYVVGSYGDYLYAINPDGSEKWKFFAGRTIAQSFPAIGSDGTIYVRSNEYIGSVDNYLYAINPDGSEKWRYGTVPSSSSPVIGSDGTIYMGGNALYAINPDGTEMWRYGTGASGFYSPVIGSDGTIYAGATVTVICLVCPYPPGLIDYGFLYAIGEGGGCPLQTITKDQSKLNLYREFRDKTLSGTERGKEYTKLYYKHSPEVVSLLLRNSKLKNASRRLLERAIPEIKLILNGKANDLSPALKNEVLGFLEKVSQKGSPRLKADIEILIGDIKEGRIKEILGGIDHLAGSLFHKNLALFSMLWPLAIPLAYVAVRRVKRGQFQVPKGIKNSRDQGFQ